jgi:hypothetical protein
VAARRRVPLAVAVLIGLLLLVPIGAAIGARMLTSPAPLHPASSDVTPDPVALASTTSTPQDEVPDVRGHLLDANGDPVGGATVHLVSPTPPLTVLAETTSGPGGTFAFAHVSTGRLRVDAEHDPQGAVRSAELGVVAGQTVEVTLVLAPANLVGTVVDPHDRPLAGVAVSVEGLPWPVPAATTDPNGAFRFGALSFEATAVVAVASGYKTARLALGAREDHPEAMFRLQLEAASPVDGDVLDPDGKPIAARVVACEGQPSEARVGSRPDGTFQLPASAIGCDAVAVSDDLAPSDPTRVVEGQRLVLRLGTGGGIAGVVVDGRGLSVPSFTVGIESFVGPHGGTARGVPARGFEAGAFRWEGLAPGTYVLTAVTSGRPPTRSDPVDVRGGAVTSGVRIVLAPGGTVMGHVYDDRHAPIAGAKLAFDHVSNVVESSASATTDGAGAYRLEGAPAGPFTLSAQKDGFRLRMLSGLRVDSGGTLTQDVTLTSADGGASFELGGIGAGLGSRVDGLVFTSIFPGDPADKAGLRSGDHILRIDGEDTAGMSLADALQRLRGEVGTSVGVSVRSHGTGDTVDVVIVRATISH